MEPSATILLHAWRGGEATALDRLLPLVYDELARIARGALRSERADHTLQTRALVHEAYLRLIDADVSWQDKAHFMAVAARTMRRVLVDHARSRRRQKRGGGAVKVELEDVAAIVTGPTVDVLDLHDALEDLAKFDPRKAEIVELHFFGGLSYDETAEAMGVSAATVDRELRSAKAYLRTQMTSRGGAATES